MFQAHVLIIRRAKFSASSWLILRNKYIEMHGQQNIKIQSGCCTVQVIHDGSRMMNKEVSTVIDGCTVHCVYICVTFITVVCNIAHEDGCENVVCWI